MEPFCTLDTLDSNTTWAPSTTWTESSTSPASLRWCPDLFGDRLQQCEWEPASAIRADVTPARFRTPQAGVIKNANGIVAIGLGDKPGRRIQGPAFETAKAAENLERLQLLEQQPRQQQPQRFAAAAEFSQMLQQRHALEEQQQEQWKCDSLAGLLHPSPEHLTSADNFLSDGLSLNCSRPAGRCTPGTPTTSTMPNSARSCSSLPVSRPNTRPASPEVAARARQALQGQLMPGSLLVKEKEEEGEEQQGKEMRQSLMAAAMAAYDEAVRKEEELIAQYPHGAPKRLIREYRAQGVQLPALGYASALPSPRHP